LTEHYYAILSCQGAPNVGAVEGPAAKGVGATVKLTHRGLVPILLTIPGANVKAVIDAAQPVVAIGAGGPFRPAGP
jgi:hypothetical protein